jgi:DNA-damage-inducible protein D
MVVCLEDVVVVLTDSSDAKQYVNKMKQRDPLLAEGWVQIVHTLSVQTGGGNQGMNCVNTEGAFRIIQSIPSQKAEPFKRWPAKVGHERGKSDDHFVDINKMVDTSKHRTATFIYN